MIRRKLVAAYCDEVSENTKAICGSCWELGITVKLSPQEDKRMLSCHLCKTVVKKDHAKHSSEIGPLGNIQGVSQGNFEVVSKRRSIKHTGGFQPTEEPVPLLAGKPDKDLEMMLQGNAILVGIIDSVDQSEETTGDRYV